ncbi:hypothetical protein BDV40DRAFT_275220 [Aspergillus tamarii]|uniref:Uncharacterized protein n=1 Tax=Aspergillus tamarii TaxID=41984 RepID=A0A5N6UJ93_ASPTM|nr:hypothetical protein BDV40DRAFT_275220 [Aspergillus tamarii]
MLLGISRKSIHPTKTHLSITRLIRSIVYHQSFGSDLLLSFFIPAILTPTSLILFLNCETNN